MEEARGLVGGKEQIIRRFQIIFKMKIGKYGQLKDSSKRWRWLWR